MAVPVQSPSPVAATYPVVKSPVESPLHKSSKDDTIASNASPIPDEEIAVVSPIPLDVEEPKLELVALDFGTQTGRSLMLSPEKQVQEVQTESPVERPSAIAIQTDDGNWMPKTVQKGRIVVLQKVDGDEETIEIATKSNIEAQPFLEQVEPSKPGEDLTVELKYKGNKEGLDSGKTMSELNILHFEPQSFETIVMEPGESSTEVIVDADGTKRIIVRKSKKTISHHQRTFTSETNIDMLDMKPVAFSQVTLQQQQKSVTHTLPDGKMEITTSQGYTGQITSGAQGKETTTAEFSNIPGREIATYHTFPSNVNLHNISESLQTTEYGVSEPTEVSEWASSSSTVRATVHQVRRKVIRRTRRIIRKVVSIDGKEQVTEEIIEEPEEEEVTEEGIPRVSIEVSKEGHGGMVVQEQFEEQEQSLQDPGVEISEILTEYPDIKLEDQETSSTVPLYEESDVKEEPLYVCETPMSPKSTSSTALLMPSDPEEVVHTEERLKTPDNFELDSEKLKTKLFKEAVPKLDNDSKDVNLVFLETERRKSLKETTESFQGAKEPKSNNDKSLGKEKAKSKGKSKSKPSKPIFNTEEMLCSKEEALQQPQIQSPGFDNELINVETGKKLEQGEIKIKPANQENNQNSQKNKETMTSPVKESNVTKQPKHKNVKGKTPSPETEENNVQKENITKKKGRKSIPQVKSISPETKESKFDEKPSLSLEETVPDQVKEKASVPKEKASDISKEKPNQDSCTIQELSSFTENTKGLTTTPTGKPEKRQKSKKQSKINNLVSEETGISLLPEETNKEGIKEPKETLSESDTEIKTKSQMFIDNESLHDVKNHLNNETSVPDLKEDTLESYADKSKSTLQLSVGSAKQEEIKPSHGVPATDERSQQTNDIPFHQLPSDDQLKNIQIEITVGETTGLKNNIPSVSSDTKVEPKISKSNCKEEMEIVKQKSGVVLPGVVQVTKAIIKKPASPSSNASSKGDKTKNKKHDNSSPDELSTPTSLAESMEIAIPESPNSSDTTKPSNQELFDVSSPRSDISQIDESIKAYDTGYDGEDKTTLDESSAIENDKNKSKKKKKKKQNLRGVIADDQSSIGPKSSDFVPSDATGEINETIQKDVMKPKMKKPGKKQKGAKTEDCHLADTLEEEVLQGSLKDISEGSASEGIVKVVEESMPTRPSSEVEEFMSTNVLTSVPVLELLATQSESVQTTTPIPEPEELVETVEISMQATQDMQDVFAQTSTPEVSRSEAYIQTVPGELVPTVEDSAQTTTPKAESPVEKADSSMQTVKEELPIHQEEEIQTDEVKFGSLDNVDSSMQTTAEVTPTCHEETVQTSPEPDKIQVSSQVDREDLIPTEDEGSQTAEVIVPRVDLSTQIKSSELIPTHDESVQTIVDEMIPSVIKHVNEINAPPKDEKIEHVEKPKIVESSDRTEAEKPTVSESKEIKIPEQSRASQGSDDTVAIVSSFKTVDSTSQTKPVQFKGNNESNESSVSLETPFKIEIEATVLYGHGADTDTPDTSISYEKPLLVKVPTSDSTDSDMSWASHTERLPNTSKSKRDKKSKHRKKESEDKEIVQVSESISAGPVSKTTEKGDSYKKRPDIKAKVHFDVDEHSASLQPELVAEITQDQNTSAVFIQAELKQGSPTSANKERVMPGFSQIVELDISSKPVKQTIQPSQPEKKTKRSKKICQRADTKALPQASMVHEPEELRGEHSPGPPEREKSLPFEPDYNKPMAAPLKSDRRSEFETVSVKGTLTTPHETKNIDFEATSNKIDIEFTLHEIPEKSLLDSEGKTLGSNLFNNSTLKPCSSEDSSLDSFKKETQYFIDSETTGDSVSTPSGSQTSEKAPSTKTKQIKKKDSKKVIKSPLEGKEHKDNKVGGSVPSMPSDGGLSVGKDLPKANENSLDIHWKQVDNLITDRLKQAQLPTTTTHMVYLPPSEPSEVSTEERSNILDKNLNGLQNAIQTRDVVVIQETIIITVETISTWLETIEYNIQRTKVDSVNLLTSNSKY